VKLQHLCARRILISVAVSNSVNGKPNAAGISRRPWTSKPRPKKEDKDLSQWPKGTTQPLTKVMASKLFSLISTSDDSLHGLLAKHPWLPPYRDLARWRKTQPWFASEWKTARQMQAEWLMQKALDLQKNATRETAHLVRVRFDVIKYIASRLHPEVWGDRPPASTNVSTTVQVGVISQERLDEIRSRLEPTRAYYRKHDGTKDPPKNLLPGPQPGP
jgi:Bacteriophage Sf6, terminase small subunit-like